MPLSNVYSPDYRKCHATTYVVRKPTGTHPLTLRARLHRASVSMLGELHNDPSNTVFIENNGVT